jgi:PAS domain S-box-containing protein
VSVPAAERRLRILFVEDSPADVELCLRALRQAGFRAEAAVAATPHEFARLLEANQFDVVLSDFNLPAWNGLEALKTLRQQRREIPFILVTGSLGEETAVDAIQLGAADFIIKDRLARLPVAVQRALEEKALRDQHARAEEALRLSEENYRQLFEANPHPMWVYDLETLRFLAVNDAAVHHYGYSRREFLGMTLKDIRPPEDVPSLLASVQHAAEGLEVAGEWRHKKKDGTLIDAEVTSHSLTFAERNARVVLAVDITQRKRAEAAVRLSEARYRELFEDSPVALWMEDFSAVKEELDELRAWGVTDLDCFFAANPDYVVRCVRKVRVLDINAAGVALFEAPNKEALIGSLPAIFTPSAYDAFRNELLAIARGQPQVEVETLGLTLKGRLRHFLVRWAVPPGHRETLDRVLVSILDFTDRVNAEEALREANEKLRALFDASPVAITVLDPQRRVLEWSRGAERIFGWTPAEVLGGPLPIVPEEKQQEFQSLAGRILGGESVGGLELRRQRKDGSPADITLSAAPLYAADGAVAGLVAAISDVTEQKLLQTQLRQAQKMEAVGRLAGGIAHDFNNLLGVIKGYSEIAVGKLPAEDPLRRPLGEIQRAADRAAALTRQLLAFSRQQVLEPRVVNLNDSVETLRGMLARLLPENIEMSAQLEPKLDSVQVDPGQLEQVIMNLALNARDAMPQGGRLTLETRNVELDETYSRTHLSAPPGPYVLLAVSDTGIGMDAETLAQVFEPFFTTKEQGKGTGLGLATVYGIVKQSGGYIWAYSEPGRGSTFKVYLPRVEEKPQAQISAPAPAVLPRGTETVLVVEDEEGLRRLAREFLETCGYKVHDARDGVEALEIVQRNSETIHLLLTDVILPRLSGRDLAVQLERLRPQVKVLYMSGYTDRAVLQNGTLEPGLAFLQKPFSLRTLAVKVREVLDG